LPDGFLSGRHNASLHQIAPLCTISGAREPERSTAALRFQNPHYAPITR
jgi:hypothetical protein